MARAQRLREWPEGSIIVQYKQHAYLSVAVRPRRLTDAAV